MKEGRNVMVLCLNKCVVASSIVLLASVATSQPPFQSMSANDLVRAVVNNELIAQDGNHKRWMYRVNREERGITTTREVVQVVEGSLDRVVAIDGRALNPREQWQEKQRIANFIKDPVEQQRVEQTKRKDAEQCRAFFKMFPNALIFSYGGREGDLIKLNYRPNPAFQPPTREARVFHDMEGEMWVDAAHQRLVRIRGQLTEDVKFAGGLLGHLEKGGHFEVQQRELSAGQWGLTYMEVEMKGRALFFKTIAVKQKEYRTDFRPVPKTLTLAEAASILTRDLLIAKR